MSKTVEFEDFSLDSEHLLLYNGGRATPLTPKVVETLVALVERCGEIVSKDDLINRLWGDTAVEESNLYQNLYVLRKALGACSDGRPMIETLRGRGYRFNGEVKQLGKVEFLLASQTTTRTYIEESVENRSERYFPNWLFPAIGAATILVGGVFGGIYFRGSLFAKAKQSSAAFERFEIKRQSETNDVTTAVMSPDGKLIAFSDKNAAIWLRNVATETNVKILAASDTIERSASAFSPDSNYIYLIQFFKYKKSEISKMSVLGGPLVKLSEDVWSGISISPDGKYLAFVRADDTVGEQAIVVVATDGASERKVVVSKPGTWFGMWGATVAWSPDGNSLACAGGYLADGKEVTVIRQFRVSDGGEISSEVTEPGWRWIDTLAWLPDGDNLLVVGGSPSAEGQIYKHTLSTGEWKRLTNDLSNYSRLSVSPDGRTILAIQVDENTGNLWTLPSSGDKGAAKQITFGRNFITDASGVSWTPDGRVVYATKAGGKWEIWIVNADGSEQTQLTQDCAGNESCGQPVVSPDGRYIVFQARADGVRNIWRMDIDGGNPIQLTNGGGFTPSLTKDGRYVIYTRPGSPAWTLWRVPIDGGASTQFSTMTTVVSVSVSPDGGSMAFQFYDKNAKQPFQTCVASITADRPEKCFGISRGFTSWAPDGKAFYYLDHGYSGVWKQPLDGERSMFVEFPGEMTTNFSFSPDGTSLVVARSKPTQNVVALTDTSEDAQ